jgi:uncharacterized protein (TIGR02246 family)
MARRRDLHAARSSLGASRAFAPEAAWNLPCQPALAASNRRVERMSDDEREIRQLVATWMSAIAAGDIDAVLALMTDDVVFLAPGREPMRSRDAFAAASAPGEPAPRIEGSSEIQEIRVLGDWAWMWTRLTVVATPRDGQPPTTRAGHTLSILRKQGGRWRLARDANMLAPVT